MRLLKNFTIRIVMLAILGLLPALVGRGFIQSSFVIKNI